MNKFFKIDIVNEKKFENQRHFQSVANKTKITNKNNKQEKN